MQTGQAGSGIQQRPREEDRRLLPSAGPHTLSSSTPVGHRHADKDIQGMSGSRRGSILQGELQQICHPVNKVEMPMALGPGSYPHQR